MLRAGVTAALALALLLPLVLLDRPPARPRLTFIGGADGLSLLVEGAGGGRVVVGGGAAQTDVAAALGRLLRPWDRRLDLLLVADARDLPGAVDLVRYGDVRRVALLGLEGTRSGGPALAALREAAGQRGVPVEELAGGERIRVGADGGVLLDVLAGQDEGATLRLSAGETVVAVVTGAVGAVEPAPLAVVLRAGQEPYRAALAAHPGLVIAPAPPAGQGAAEGSVATRLAIVGPGQRATLELGGRTLRLSGPEVQALATSTPRR